MVAYPAAICWAGVDPAVVCSAMATTLMPRTVSVIAQCGVGTGLLAKFRADVTLTDRAYR
ncbi:hypothetical protein OKHIF_06560 [Mycobacteroides chelonae]